MDLVSCCTQNTHIIQGAELNHRPWCVAGGFAALMLSEHGRTHWCTGACGALSSVCQLFVVENL
jgi:hypothetical protein